MGSFFVVVGPEFFCATHTSMVLQYHNFKFPRVFFRLCFKLLNMVFEFFFQKNVLMVLQYHNFTLTYSLHSFLRSMDGVVL